jgi:protein-disulfide isomerase-like protein with CxxC motif
MFRAGALKSSVNETNAARSTAPVAATTIEPSGSKDTATAQTAPQQKKKKSKKSKKYVSKIATSTGQNYAQATVVDTPQRITAPMDSEPRPLAAAVEHNVRTFSSFPKTVMESECAVRVILIVVLLIERSY